MQTKMSIQSKRSCKRVRPMKLSQTNIFHCQSPLPSNCWPMCAMVVNRKLKNGNKPRLPCLAFDAGAISCSTSLDYKLLLIHLVSNISQYTIIYYNVLQSITNNTLQTASNMWHRRQKVVEAKTQMVLKHAMYSLRCRNLRIRMHIACERILGWRFQNFFRTL